MPNLVALSAGSFFPGTPRGHSVWLFTLDGRLGPGPGIDAAVDEGAEAAAGDDETLEH